MVIYLKEGDSLTADFTNSDAIENLAYNCRIGNHILLGDRNLLEEIASTFIISDRARSFLRQSAQRMTQQGSLINKVSWLLTIDTSNLVPGMVHLTTFSNANYCEKSQLLTENLSDSMVLTSLAEHFASVEFKGYKVVIRQVAGGGSTTGQCLHGLTSSPSGAVLCIVDSDRTFDGAAIGDTAKGTRKKYKASKDKWRSSFHIIEQRELENLIPDDILLHCVNKFIPAKSPEANALLQTSTFFKDYFCVKSGDSTCRVVNSMIGKKRLSKLKEARGHVDSPLVKAESCGTCALDNNCRTSPGFGAGFLSLVAQELSEGNIALDCSSWRAELLKLVERVASFGLGASPIRV
ncbi:hypothetical protein [Stenotrophomonas sp.]|uniref:hypothetical protein n=1 Tax=Stenotrophomonas sp. TaxID=69392 RepID=UPI0028999F88|nr:hypothetical protein [Stenotrophomonas sp.]